MCERWRVCEGWRVCQIWRVCGHETQSITALTVKGRQGNNMSSSKYSTLQLVQACYIGAYGVHLVFHVGEVHCPNQGNHVNIGNTKMRRYKVKVYHLYNKTTQNHSFKTSQKYIHQLNSLHSKKI